MTPKGYRVATEDDIGKKCLFTNIVHSIRYDDYLRGSLYGIETSDFGSYYIMREDGREWSQCYVKKENKTTTLDPMLDARLTNIDRMILEREIELKLLRKLKGEENE